MKFVHLLSFFVVFFVHLSYSQLMLGGKHFDYSIGDIVCKSKIEGTVTLRLGTENVSVPQVKCNGSCGQPDNNNKMCQQLYQMLDTGEIWYRGCTLVVVY